VPLPIRGEALLPLVGGREPFPLSGKEVIRKESGRGPLFFEGFFPLQRRKGFPFEGIRVLGKKKKNPPFGVLWENASAFRGRLLSRLGAFLF